MKYFLILFFLIFAIKANASEISYSYVGGISSMFYSDCQIYNSSGDCESWDITYPSTSSFFKGIKFSEGDVFSGQFAYNTDAILSDIINNQAVYLDAILDYRFNLGEYDTSLGTIPPSGNGSISIVNDRNENYDSFYTSQWFSSDDWFSSITVDLQDSSGSRFNNYQIPSLLELDDFTTPYFTMAFLRKSDRDQLHLRGQLTELNPEPVPEPSTIFLLGSGLLGLGWYGRKRKKA